MITPTNNALAGYRVKSGAFARFLLSGGFNTAVTYALYLALLPFLSYRVSYTIAFAGGIVLAYALNRLFVFRAKGTLLTLCLFPLVYILQYGVGLAVVSLWVEWLHGMEWLAPAVAIFVTVPLTFLLCRLLFHGRRE